VFVDDLFLLLLLLWFAFLYFCSFLYVNFRQLSLLIDYYALPCDYIL